MYDRKPAQIAAAVELLVSHQTLAVQDADVLSAAVEQFRKKPALGFSDCLLLEVARRAGHVPLVTFDRDLGRLSGAQRIPVP